MLKVYKFNDVCRKINNYSNTVVEWRGSGINIPTHPYVVKYPHLAVVYGDTESNLFYLYEPIIRKKIQFMTDDFIRDKIHSMKSIFSDVKNDQMIIDKANKSAPHHNSNYVNLNETVETGINIIVGITYEELINYGDNFAAGDKHWDGINYPFTGMPMDIVKRIKEDLYRNRRTYRSKRYLYHTCNPYEVEALVKYSEKYKLPYKVFLYSKKGFYHNGNARTLARVFKEFNKPFAIFDKVEINNNL